MPPPSNTMQDHSISTPTAAPKVACLGYLGFTSSRLAEWDRFAQSIAGLERHPDSSESELLLRMDTRSFRLAIERGESEALACMGWEMPSPQALDAMRGKLEEAGVPAQEASDEVLRKRRVLRMIQCKDPAGNNVELVSGHRVQIGPFSSPRGVKFVTGHTGMGHLVLLIDVSQYEATLSFYTQLLGLKVSDVFRFKGRTATFLRCNERHHSLALISGEGAPKVAHCMLETSELDDVGFALDACYALGFVVKRSLGRHSNDRALSFYVETPSGFDLEYGWGGRAVDDETWVVTEVDHGTLWGHRPSAPSYAL